MLRPEIRHSVNFYEWNVVAENVPFHQGAYDFIFCRNLLIYFDRPTQEAVINKLCRNLALGGYLFISHSESLAGLKPAARDCVVRDRTTDTWS